MGGLAPALRETRLRAALSRRDDLAGRRQPQPCRAALVRLSDQPLDLADVTRRRGPDAATVGARALDRSLSRQAAKATGADRGQPGPRPSGIDDSAPARGAPARAGTALPHRLSPLRRRHRRRARSLDRGAAAGRPCRLRCGERADPGHIHARGSGRPSGGRARHLALRNFEGALSRRRELRCLRDMRRVGTHPRRSSRPPPPLAAPRSR